jgi:Putative collagen-binding domain of a collagenase
MAYEGSRQVGLMRRLFELRPWYKLVPDQSVIAAEQGEGEDHVRSARAEDGSFVIAYLPSGKPLSIKMDKLSGKTVKAQWYDPREGTWREIGEYPNSGNHEFVAPTQGRE